MSEPALMPPRLLHPLSINSYRHWRRLYRDSGGVHARHRTRVLLTHLIAPLFAPLRMAEAMLYDSKVAATAVEPQPLFILGHWRSGTTHLHNLLSQDPELGFFSTLHTVAPQGYLLGKRFLHGPLARTMPRKRPMDNMDMAPDLPQEEEVGMANMCGQSFYVGWYFPERMPELFTRYVLMEGLTPQELEQWKLTYLRMLQKAMYANPGKRLVLKSPTNTGRIPQLLELFPDAKFIYIHRNPYKVFASTVHLHFKTCEMVGFQHLDMKQIEGNVLDFYKRMLLKYEADKRLIPQGNLMEIAYDDLSKRPMETIENIYGTLGLDSWESARPLMRAYLKAQAGYQKNTFSMDLATIERIEKEWGFAIEQGGYKRPEVK